MNKCNICGCSVTDKTMFTCNRCFIKYKVYQWKELYGREYDLAIKKERDK